MWEAILQADQELFLWLNSQGTPFWDPFWLVVTNKATNAVVYLVVLAYLVRKGHGKQVGWILLATGLLILLTDQTTNLFKHGVGRLRPCHQEALEGLVRLVKKSCGGKYSFFSGHASNSFALAFFFGRLVEPHQRKLIHLLGVIAAMIAYSRIYVGVHFPTDITVGALVGTLYGTVFYRVWSRLTTTNKP
ncbi:MAG: phosphatase PAP2 family protein [Flavobacteriaceae bacterium]